MGEMVKKLGKVLGILVLFYLLAVLTHGFWLPPIAKLLIVRNQLPKVDVIVVSTGSYKRFRHAVELMLNDQVENLLILGDRRIVTLIPGKSPLDLAEEEAVALGLQSRRFILEHSTSTLVDARVAKDIMTDRGFKTAGVVSDSYNMRRLAMIFDHVFSGSSLGLYYLTAETRPDQLHPGQWWLHPAEFKYVMMEWVKIPLDFFRIHFLLDQ